MSVDSTNTGVAFVYSSQGREWVGMGRALLAEEPVFRDAIERCDVAIGRRFGWSLLEELNAPPDVYRAHVDDSLAKLAVTSLHIALTDALAARGVRPNAVGSLSLGEMAAAYAAGAITLAETIEIGCSLVDISRAPRATGTMAVVTTSFHEIEALIGERRPVWPAVELSRHQTVISGDDGAVRAVLARAAAAGLQSRVMRLPLAYHSPHIDSLAGQFQRPLHRLRPRTPAIAFYGNGGGRRDDFSPEGWWRLISAPSLLYSEMRAMIAGGCRRFVEIGPDPMLSWTLQEAAAELRTSVDVHCAMRRGASAPEALDRVARALCAGEAA